MRYPRQIMGRIIGKQGMNIRNFRESSGARIDAEDDRDGEHGLFRISGSPAAIERAKEMIDEVARKASADGPIGSGIYGSLRSDTEGGGTTESLDFPMSLFGGIIGAKGAKINDVRQSSGAKVTVEKIEDASRCKVHITGSAEQVQRAKVMVRTLAEEALKAESAGMRGPTDTAGESTADGVTEVMEFPITAAGRIIGSRGAHISEVRQRSGASIRVEKLEDQDICRVHISGSPGQIEKAKAMVNGASDDTGSRRNPGEGEDHMQVPMSLVGRVIGKGGDTIQRLQRESGARIDVNTNSGDPCPVRITGSRDAVSRARYMLHEVLERGGVTMGGPPPPAWGPPVGAWPPPPEAWPPAWPPVPGAPPWGPPMPSSSPANVSIEEEIDPDEL